MARELVALLLIITCLQVGGRELRQEWQEESQLLRRLLQESVLGARISGGDDAPRGRFPYMVSVRDSNGKHNCGAVIVHPFFCLTAAHCVHPESEESLGTNSIVAIGGYDRQNNDGVKMVKVQRTFVHPDYIPSALSKGSDIALLQLSEGCTETPIPLPDPQHISHAYDRLLALGWGRGTSSTNLQHVSLGVVPTGACQTAWEEHGVVKSNFEKAMMCAYSTTADTCKGDSGGPLLIPFYRDGRLEDGQASLDTLVALTSFGDIDCEKHELPGVYTLVAPFIEWIETTIANANPPPPPQAAPSPPPPSPPFPSPTLPPPTPAPQPPASPPGSPPPTSAPSQRRAPSTLGLDATALYIAAGNGEVDEVKRLISAGTSIEFTAATGWTPLLFAAAMNHAEVVKVLADAGANIEAQTEEGDTALSRAVFWPDPAAVHVLIAAGANINHRNNDGITPLARARSFSYGEVVKVLEAAGATE